MRIIIYISYPEQEGIIKDAQNGAGVIVLLTFNAIVSCLSCHLNKLPVVTRMQPIVMKVVYSSMMLLPVGRGFSMKLLCVLSIHFLAANAFGSDELEHQQNTIEKVRK